ncbi:MAG TPA: GDSL-type esterase/lipase family protein [Kiritimatiellia bacterium]|nr:GDSL-type esterase/lipase family protein [Kiritimatiellia bacterium]
MSYLRLVFTICIGVSCLRPGLAVAIQPTDFNHNGADDLAVFVPLPANSLWYIQPRGINPVIFGGVNEYPVPGDYNNDGFADAMLYNMLNGNWRGREIMGNPFSLSTQWGFAGAYPVPGDYDGDGRSDYAVYHRATGNWYIRNTFGNTLAWALGWGFSQAVPVPGDYNGDGKTDLAVYHRATGNWYVRQLNGSVVAFALSWGFAKAWPVPGDYDGDGITDYAVYQRGTGSWFIRSNTGKVLAWNRQWGFPGAQPVAGDFDGDGKADLAVYHRETGNWYIQKLDGTLIAWNRAWGWKDAVPLQAYAQPAAAAVDVIAFGDSITYGSGSSSDGPATGYPILLERKLARELGVYVNIINASRPGEKTWEGRNRLPGVLAANAADVLLLMEGTNDALFDFMFVSTAGNLRDMLLRARARNMLGVVATIPPVITTSRLNRSIQHGRIRAFNPSIPGIAAGVGFPFADVYGGITSVPNWQNALMDQNSANHPNDAGYARIRDVFFQVIQSQNLSGRIYQ